MVDECLIARIQQHATGANAHRRANAVMVYRHTDDDGTRAAYERLLNQWDYEDSREAQLQRA